MRRRSELCGIGGNSFDMCIHSTDKIKKYTHK